MYRAIDKKRDKLLEARKELSPYFVLKAGFGDNTKVG